jgi:large subunit ribosomal protein L25
MKEIVLNAEVRSQVGKRAKSLRRTGVVPGIYYIRGEAAVPVSAPLLAITQLGKDSEAHIIRLKTGDGVERRCVLRVIDFDPVSDRPIHFDLLGVRSDETIRVEIPIVLKGVAQGQKDGGLVQHVLHRLRIECLPDNIPEHIEINIEPLLINHSVHVRDIALVNVHVLENPNSTVVAVIPPVVEKVATPEEVAAAAAAVSAEPEVIKKGKAEEEGDRKSVV